MCARSHPRQWLVLILLLAFALRMVLTLSNLNTALSPDERGYLNRAVLVATEIGQDRDVFRSPLYPYSLALLFKTIGDNRFVISTYNALLDLVSIALLYVLARRAVAGSRPFEVYATVTSRAILRIAETPKGLQGRGPGNRAGVAVVTAFLFAVFPPALGLTGSLLSEPLFMALMLGGLVLVLSSVERSSLALAFSGGALLALAALTREVGLYFALLVIPVWWILFTGGSRRARTAQAAVFLLGMVLVLTPWVIRNGIVEQRFLVISTSGEFNFVRDNVRAAILAGDETSVNARTGALNREIHAELEAQAPNERAGYAYRRGLELITQSGWEWLGFKAAALAPLWSPFQFDRVNLGITSLSPPLIPVANSVVSGFLIALMLCATVGFVAAPDNAAKLLIALFLLYSLVLFLLTHYQLRYRYPIHVLMLPYMAYGLWVVGKIVQTRALNPRWLGAPRLAMALIPLTLFGMLIVMAAQQSMQVQR